MRSAHPRFRPTACGGGSLAGRGRPCGRFHLRVLPCSSLCRFFSPRAGVCVPLVAADAEMGRGGMGVFYRYRELACGCFGLPLLGNRVRSCLRSKRTAMRALCCMISPLDMSECHMLSKTRHRANVVGRRRNAGFNDCPMQYPATRGVEWCRGSKSGVPHTHEAACALLAFATFPGTMIRRCIPQRLTPRPLDEAKGERGARLKSCGAWAGPHFITCRSLPRRARRRFPKSVGFLRWLTTDRGVHAVDVMEMSEFPTIQKTQGVSPLLASSHPLLPPPNPLIFLKSTFNVLLPTPCIPLPVTPFSNCPKNGQLRQIHDYRLSEFRTTLCIQWVASLSALSRSLSKPLDW